MAKLLLDSTPTSGTGGARPRRPRSVRGAAASLRGMLTRLRRRARATTARVHPVVMILIGVVLGLSVGLALSLTDAHELWAVWLGMPGTLYLRALKLLVGPLVFCSVIVGFSALSELGVSSSSIGPRCALLYLATSVAGSLEGLLATYMLKPAWGDIAVTEVTVEPATATFDAVGLASPARVS